MDTYVQSYAWQVSLSLETASSLTSREELKSLISTPKTCGLLCFYCIDHIPAF